MRPRSIVAVCSALALMGSGCGAPSAGPLSDEDIATIQEMFDTALQDMLSGDFEGWAAVFSDDAVLMPPNRPAVRGRAAILAFGQESLSFTELAWPDRRIEGHGDVAYVTTNYSFTAEPEGMPAVQDTGKQLVVMRRQADGSWRTVAVSYNSDLPMPEQ